MAGFYTRHQAPDLGKHPLTKWQRLTRFLILGIDGPTYYASEQKQVADFVQLVQDCLKEDPYRTINEAIRVSEAGLAKSNEAAVFVMAMSSYSPYSLDNMQRVVRTSYHLFQYMDIIKKLKPRGFGTSLNRAIARWYADKSDQDVAYQLVKYRQRAGWTHRDVMMHGRPKHREVYKFAKPGTTIDLALMDIKAANMIQSADAAIHGTDPVEVAHAVRVGRLPWETVPTQMLNETVIWDALFEVGVPYIAMLRNINRMDKLGPKYVEKGLAILTDSYQIRKSKVHPMQILNAWAMNPDNAGIQNGLESAFYDSFPNVEPTGKRILMCLDVSGSMNSWGYAYGRKQSPLTPREISVAMAMITVATEPNVQVMAFSDTFIPLSIATHVGALRGNIGSTSRLPFSNTDCTIPTEWAGKNRIPVDAFVVYTDNETNANRYPPSFALQGYRNEMGLPDSKMIVCAVTTNNVSIADPNDPHMLDVAGFSPDVPGLINSFIKGW